MAEKLKLFYKLLKAEVPINITSEVTETFDSVNKALSDACELAIKQPIPGKQPVLMTDANFKNAGYALMMEDNTDQKIQSKRKNYAPVAIGSNISRPRTTKDVDLLERVPGNVHGICLVCTHFVGSNKTNNYSDGQQIGQMILPDKSFSAIIVERMWICAAVQH